MAEQSQPGDVRQYKSLPRGVGIVQNIPDAGTIVRGDQAVPTPTLRNPSRDAFLALHRSVLRIPSSVELSVSSKASSQETLDEPSAVARWSERFEEAFHSESSLTTDVAKAPEKVENEKQQDSNKTYEALSNSKSGIPRTPLVISPDCASITSASCPSITSGSITGFEFPLPDSHRNTVDHSNVTNGDATIDVTVSNYMLGSQITHYGISLIYKSLIGYNVSDK